MSFGTFWMCCPRHRHPAIPHLYTLPGTRPKTTNSNKYNTRQNTDLAPILPLERQSEARRGKIAASSGKIFGKLGVFSRFCALKQLNALKNVALCCRTSGKLP